MTTKPATVKVVQITTGEVRDAIVEIGKYETAVWFPRKDGGKPRTKAVGLLGAWYGKEAFALWGPGREEEGDRLRKRVEEAQTALGLACQALVEHYQEK